jgi:AcrR family transcriptional regulator
MEHHMPKIVDHEDRRQELARATLRVIGRDGFESATTRAVAEESGWSTGVLKHYFANKDQLLREALRELERINLERFRDAAEQPSGLESIRSAIANILRATPDESRVWAAFMSRAASDAPTAQAMRRAIDAWVQRWQSLVERGQQDGSIRPGLDARTVAGELHALVNGLSLSGIFRRAPDRSDAASPEIALLDALAPRPNRRTR